jgi:hypothetical protein
MYSTFSTNMIAAGTATIGLQHSKYEISAVCSQVLLQNKIRFYMWKGTYFSI